MGASESTVQDSRRTGPQIGIFTVDPVLKEIPSSPEHSARLLAEHLIRTDPSIPRLRYFVSVGSPVIVISTTLDSQTVRSTVKELIDVVFTPVALAEALGFFREVQLSIGNSKAEATLEAYLESCVFFVSKSPEDLKALVEEKFIFFEKKSATPWTFSIPLGHAKLRTLISDAAKSRSLKVIVNERDI